MPLAQWLLSEAKRLGIRGATLNGSIQGLGHDGKTHAINLFDFSDQPVPVALVVNDEEAGRLFAHLVQEQVRVFYMKIPAEFGISGRADADLPPISPL
jgi:PII-like signaling protein